MRRDDSSVGVGCEDEAVDGVEGEDRGNALDGEGGGWGAVGDVHCDGDDFDEKDADGRVLGDDAFEEGDVGPEADLGNGQ